MTRSRAVAVMLLAALAVLPAQAVLARPGDLSVSMNMSPSLLEARPTDVSATVVFHGNVTFDQPLYQRATADMNVTVDRNWTAVVTPSRLVNRGPGTQSFAVAVTVPTTAIAGEVANVLVTAHGTTRLNTEANASASVAVRVLPWSGYVLDAPDPIMVSAPQDSEAAISFKVRNIGSVDERYAVSAPYWYGLQRYGLVIDTPPPLPVRAHEAANVIVHVTVKAGVVPRVYEVQLLVDAMSMPDEGSGPAGDPKWARAWLNVTGLAPPGDRYAAWQLEGGPDTVPEWRPVFGSSEARAEPDVDEAGRNIAYSQGSGEGSAIYIGKLDGSGADQLTRGDAEDRCPVLSPKGDRVAFVRDDREVVVMSSNGTILDTLDLDLEDVTLTDWSPTGDRVLLTSEGDVHELDLATGATRPLASEPVRQWGATYSPDGARVYYLSKEAAGRTSEIWSMGPDGSDHQQVTFNDHDERTVSVSPNGQRLAFSLKGDGTALDRLCVVSSDGKGAKWVTPGGTELDAVRWLPDGHGLVAEVSTGGGGQGDVMRLDYPWTDAGHGGGGDGGGVDDDGGSGGAGGSPIAALGNPYLLTGIILLAVLIVGPLAYARYDRRRRTDAADRLRARMERDSAARGGDGDAKASVATGPRTGPADDFRMGYAAYDVESAPTEAEASTQRVMRRVDVALDEYR